MVFRVIVAVLTAYLLGGINPAIELSKKVMGKDIRTMGSGNPGSSNVQRVMGGKWAALVVVLDFSKAAVAILFAQFLCAGFDFEAGMMIRLMAGAAAIIGHIWPVWYGFKGGKGVMTAAATALFFHPLLLLVCLAVFVGIVAATRYISLGSMISNAVFPVLCYIFYPDRLTYKIIAILIPLLVIVKHRSNIIRLFNHTENKLNFKKKPKAE